MHFNLAGGRTRGSTRTEEERKRYLDAAEAILDEFLEEAPGGARKPCDPPRWEWSRLPREWVGGTRISLGAACRLKYGFLISSVSCPGSPCPPPPPLFPDSLSAPTGTETMCRSGAGGNTQRVIFSELYGGI